MPRFAQGTRSRFGWFAKIGVALVATLGALLVGELVVRLFAFAPEVKPIWLKGNGSDAYAYRRSMNPILGFELKPSYRNDHPDLAVSVPRTNAHGQRDVERTIEKPSGTKRILLLGDSVVEGHRVSDLEDLMSRQLERLYPDGHTEVLNFGVSGYCTRAEVELLETKGLAFKPDIVVLVFTENDFQNFNPEAAHVDAAARRPELVKRLFLGSHLFRLACIRFNWFRFGSDANPVDWNRAAIGQNNVVQGLQRLRQLQDRHGFRLLIAVWPRFEEQAIVDLHRIPGSDDLIIERLGSYFQIPVVRLSTGFREHFAAQHSSLGPRRTYTVGDQIHPNPLGHRMAASFLKAALDDVEHGRLVAHAKAGAEAEGLKAIEAALAAGKVDGFAHAIHDNNVGKQLQDEGKLEEARVYYQKALQAQPNYPEALLNLGLLAMACGELGEARTRLEAALQAKPDFAQAHLGLGVLAARTNRLPEAQQHFREALRIDPESAEAHNNLGLLLLQLRKPKEAQKCFETALRQQPDNAVTRCNLAGSLRHQRLHEQAISQYQQALRLNPKLAKAHNDLGLSYAELGRLLEARDQFRQAIRVDPSFKAAQANLDRAEQEIRVRGLR